jgi:flagellar motor switch protein FliN/FliY
MSEQQQGATNPAELVRALDQATRAVAVQSQQLDELGDHAGAAGRGEPIGMANLMDVPVRVTVEVGRAKIPLADLVELAPGSLVALDREVHEPADILVNGKIVARGEVVTMDGHYGVRVTSVK